MTAEDRALWTAVVEQEFGIHEVTILKASGPEAKMAFITLRGEIHRIIRQIGKEYRRVGRLAKQDLV